MEKVQCMSLRSIHIHCNHDPVQAQVCTQDVPHTKRFGLLIPTSTGKTCGTPGGMVSPVETSATLTAPRRDEDAAEEAALKLKIIEAASKPTILDELGQLSHRIFGSSPAQSAAQSGTPITECRVDETEPTAEEAAEVNKAKMQLTMSVVQPASSAAAETERGISGGQLLDMVVKISHRVFGPSPGDTGRTPASPPLGSSGTIAEENDEGTVGSASIAGASAAGPSVQATAASEALLAELLAAQTPVPVESPSNHRVRQPEYGLQKFVFAELTPLGIGLNLMAQKDKAGKRALIIDEVMPGTQADLLRVPVGTVITGLNGRFLKPDELWEKLKTLADPLPENRPVTLTLFIEPPKKS